MRRALIGSAVCLLVLLAAAPGAQASTCSFTPATHTLDIAISTAHDVAGLAVDAQNEIKVSDLTGAITCTNGPPKVTNTDTINVDDNSGGNTSVALQRPNRFAPGFSANGEGGGRNEIEIDVNLGAGTNDLLALNGYPSNRLNLRIGSQGVNTNAIDLGTGTPDVDVTVSGVDVFSIVGSRRGDTVIGQGAVPGDNGTGQTATLVINSAGANDILGGSDTTPDSFDGGSGADTVTYAGAVTAVAGEIDGQIYQNNTVTGLDTLNKIENLIGGPKGDGLTGDANANVIKGGRGPDLLKGLGGPDELHGDRGSDILRGNADIDTLFALDHNIDTEINCGGGSNAAESATVDPQDPAPLSC